MPGIMDYERPAITADCVLFSATSDVNDVTKSALSLQVLLVNRPNPPEKGKWALLGAFVPVEDRIEDVMRDAVRNKGGYYDDFYAEQLHTFDTPGRDERWRVISVSYIGVARGSALSCNEPRRGHAAWFVVDTDSRTLHCKHLGLHIGFDELAFDHGSILSTAITRLEEKILSTDMALHFLEEPFLIKDIKGVVETVTRKPSSNTQRTFSRFIEKAGDTGATRQSDDDSENGTKRPAHRPGILYRRKRP